MNIELNCASCERKFKVKTELAGKKVKCPCGQILVVPLPEVTEHPNDFELLELEPSEPSDFSNPYRKSPHAGKRPVARSRNKSTREIMTVVGGWVCAAVVVVFFVLAIAMLVVTGEIRQALACVVLSFIPGLFAVACLVPQYRHISIRVVGGVLCLMFLGGFLFALNDPDAQEHIRKPGIFLALAAAMGTMAIKGRWPFGGDES